jgi:hypothetical protein
LSKLSGSLRLIFTKLFNRSMATCFLFSLLEDGCSVLSDVVVFLVMNEVLTRSASVFDIDDLSSSFLTVGLRAVFFILAMFVVNTPMILAFESELCIVKIHNESNSLNSICVMLVVQNSRNEFIRIRLHRNTLKYCLFVN